MRLTRTGEPAKDAKQQGQDLQEMDIDRLQAKYKEVLGEDTISRNKEVLIEQIQRGQYSKGLKAKREARKRAAEAKSAADPATLTDRLAALTEMPLGTLREEYEKVLGKASLSRNRKQLIKKIAEKIQAEAAPETMSAPIPAPTLTVKFERKGRTKRHSKAKAAPQGRETASSRATRRPGQRDPRLPKPGTTVTRE